MNFSYEQLRRCTVAVDLGADRTRVYLRQSGVVVDEPSVVAVDTRSGALMAVGTPARRMHGRTPPHIRVVRPIADGTVHDVRMAQRMLRAMVGEKVRRAWRRRPLLRAAMCVPHDADPLAQRSAVETLTGLGCRRVELVDTLVAAAVGCGLPAEQPEATMIVLCCADTTHVAVLSLGAIVAAGRVGVGGETLYTAIGRHLRNHHGITVPSETVRTLHAEAVAAETGGHSGDGDGLVVHGRDAGTGLARLIRVGAPDLLTATHAPLMAVVDTIRGILHRCPPDLVADLADRGIMLAGDYAELPGLADRLRQSTSMTVGVAEDPAAGAINGVTAMMEGAARPLLIPSLNALDSLDGPR
ncbi:MULTISPECIES: rod shape-determining protein [unclassified Streptomyces]|uniref:rod shape-determining protein n=1 Tax=unclassified Streptomyces TaxID=2593676 RepID=UPI0022B745A1|nr:MULTISPECIES: rod shape-determining protein [unclassified Streptomyces]MCZ7415108.1 rod shape-determining protein [Streptomyces sp. WMMC897]MCZ7432051.1 rod shape-determining protein [Streptomyces sp. WMMC1477]